MDPGFSSHRIPHPRGYPAALSWSRNCQTSQRRPIPAFRPPHIQGESSNAAAAAAGPEAALAAAAQVSVTRRDRLQPEKWPNFRQMTIYRRNRDVAVKTVTYLMLWIRSVPVVSSRFRVITEFPPAQTTCAPHHVTITAHCDSCQIVAPIGI